MIHCFIFQILVLLFQRKALKNFGSRGCQLSFSVPFQLLVALCFLKLQTIITLFHFCKFILQTYICMFWRIVGLYHYSFMLMWWSTFGYLWGRAGTTTQEGVFFFPIYCFCLQNVHSVVCSFFFANLCWSDREMLTSLVLSPDFWLLSMLNWICEFSCCFLLQWENIVASFGILVLCDLRGWVFYSFSQFPASFYVYLDILGLIMVWSFIFANFCCSRDKYFAPVL